MKALSYSGAALLGLFISAIGMWIAYATANDHFPLMLGGLLAIYLLVIGFISKKIEEDEEQKNYSILLVLPFFIFLMLGQLLVAIGQGWALVVPNSEAFDEACKDAGATYFKQPSTSVNSIAFDWDFENTWKHTNGFRSLFGSRLSQISGVRPAPTGEIEFIETRISKYEDIRKPGKHIGYKRERKGQANEIIPEFTADVLVSFHTLPIATDSKKVESKPIKYEISILDRRTSEKLAILRYVLDEEKRRGCGFTDRGEMSESGFISKAIGKKFGYDAPYF